MAFWAGVRLEKALSMSEIRALGPVTRKRQASARMRVPRGMVTVAKRPRPLLGEGRIS